VDRCRRQAGLNQFDPAAVDDLVVARSRHSHGPAQVVGNAETEAVHVCTSRLSGVASFGT
jgi:hypothetical protein